jgi:hypothetical protein
MKTEKAKTTKKQLKDKQKNSMNHGIQVTPIWKTHKQIFKPTTKNPDM